jgi:hypothetical protein
MPVRWRSWPRPGEGVGLLFVDADHSYEGIVRDLQAWTPHLAPGALVAFHDVNLPLFGVTRAIYHHIYRNPLFDAFEQFDSLLVTRFSGARPHREVTARTRRARSDAGVLVAS